MKWWKWSNLSMGCFVWVCACVCGLCSVLFMCVWNFWFFVAQGLPPCLWQGLSGCLICWPHEWLWMTQSHQRRLQKVTFALGFEFSYIRVRIYWSNTITCRKHWGVSGSCIQSWQRVWDMVIAGWQTCVGLGWPNLLLRVSIGVFRNSLRAQAVITL